MDRVQKIIALDLEGVLLPEIWQRVAEITKISTLAMTTRDVKDYNQLMSMRIEALKENNITLSDIQDIIEKDIFPFDGAVQFLQDIRAKAELVIISDTFLEFFDIVRARLEYPVVFCNSLVCKDDVIQRHVLRLQDGKTKAVKSLQTLNFQVAAAGDSYNDIGMIQQADLGVLFKAPDTIAKEYPTIATCDNYDELRSILFGFL